MTTTMTRSPRLRSPSTSVGHRWVPAVAGWLCAGIGIIDLASALTPEIRSRMRVLHQYVPGTVAHSATAATVVTGLSLVLLSRGLWRRKRRAWQAVTALVTFSIALHMVKGLDVEEATLSAAMLVGLVRYRRAFFAEPDPRSRWRAVTAFIGLGVVSVILGVLLLEFHRRALIPPQSIGKILQEVLAGLVGATGPMHYRDDRVEDLVSRVLFGLGWFTVLTTAYLALRPPPQRPTISPRDEARMRELLAAYGCNDSLGYFALRRDKSVVWSASGKSCIAYRVVGGVMLAAGDPLGDPEAWPGAVDAFLEEARRHAWIPAVMGCGERAGRLWTKFGMTALELGDEAIVDVDEFSLEGRAMRGVRQAVHRVRRAGYVANVSRVGDLSPSALSRITNHAAAWRGAEVERGFSMALGRFGDRADSAAVIVSAELDGEVRGLLHFVPWGDDGLSLDLMRRDRTADNGLNEFLIVSAIEAARGLGVRRLSLNFAVFRSALERGERLGAGPVSRAWRSLLLFLSRWFQIESLYRFNAKFRPIWSPRFVCYRRVADMPRVALSALTAEAFIVWPRPTLRRLRHLMSLPRA